MSTDRIEKTIQGQVTYPGYEHVTMDMTIGRVEPERYFSWRWHPNAVESAVDYSKEPTTLVEFHLEEVEGRHPAHRGRIRLRRDPPSPGAPRPSRRTREAGRSGS